MAYSPPSSAERPFPKVFSPLRKNGRRVPAWVAKNPGPFTLPVSVPVPPPSLPLGNASSISTQLARKRIQKRIANLDEDQKDDIVEDIQRAQLWRTSIHEEIAGLEGLFTDAATLLGRLKVRMSAMNKYYDDAEKKLDRGPAFYIPSGVEDPGYDDDFTRTYVRFSSSMALRG